MLPIIHDRSGSGGTDGEEARSGSARGSARVGRGGVRDERFIQAGADRADDPNNANLTYWYWAETTPPAPTNWLKKEVALYEKAHPEVKIHVVIQSTDTLISAFTTAAQTGAARTSRRSGRRCRC